MRDGKQPQSGWIQRARSGDPALLVDLRHHLRGSVLASLGNCAGCGVEAEDILSETLVIVFKTLARLRDERCLLSYAIAIAKNLRERARKRYSRFKGPLPASRDRESRGSLLEVPDSGLSNLMRDEWFLQMMQQLEASQLLLFALLYVHGESDKDARDRLGISKSSFRVRKHRLLARLRKLAREEY